MYPKKQLAQLVIQACQHYQVDTVVISPGSRNAPLTIGFSNAEGISSFSIVDERAAAFFALGIAQQTQKPVVIVCTSGSALLNYYPAIAEAFYSRIPLVVISADRPKHLIDVGDGQTIRQENVFANHILYSANLDEDVTKIESNKTEVSNAFQTALLKNGPVHINVPFDEPIYQTVEKMDTFSFDKLPSIDKSTEVDFEQLSEVWNSSQKKLIIIGVHHPCTKTQQIINNLVEDPSVLVMTETTSNIHHEKVINSIDKLITKLTDEEFKALQPDLLVTFGGMVVSKRIKQFLRTYQPNHHWHIDPQTKLDTYFCLSEFVQLKPDEFFTDFNKYIKSVASSYQQQWVAEKEARNVNHEKFLKDTPYSDLKVSETILTSLPNNSQLQISNSALIRYAQLFDVNPTCTYFCNRGTSGIDGSTSTAIGAALVSEKQTTLLTGDLSFFYDSNALWNSYVPKDFRILLVNNSGGGIFKIIPGPKSTNALRFFETPHKLTAKHLAEMFNFEYHAAHSEEELKTNLKHFYKESEQPKILEVFTPTDENSVILKQYFNSL